MQSLIVAATYCAFLILGMRAPFVLALGYVWTDLFMPQQVSSLLASVPVSLIMAAATVLGYLLLDRRRPPRLCLGIILPLLFGLWITLTTTWAEVPFYAWAKWNWAVKTVVFSAFMPFFFRSRVQIEALLLTVLFAVGGNAIAFGLKTVFGGGGYGKSLGLLSSNVGLGEGSTLAMVCVALLPLITYVRDYSLILPSSKWMKPIYAGAMLAGVAASLGTFARTGLVCMGVYAGVTWLRSRRKVLYAVLFVAAAGLSFSLMGDRWTERMSTISNAGSEPSALGRLGVWMWTWNYVADHPLGGGFEVYRINNFEVPIKGEDDSLAIHGKAFHNIFFEVLGEHGYVGAAIYLAMILYFFANMIVLWRKTRKQENLIWLNSLSGAVMFATALYIIGGMFVGVAFQPLLYIMCATGISLRQYYERSPSDSLAAARRKARLRPGRDEAA